jgi:hypothetical protein
VGQCEANIDQVVWLVQSEAHMNQGAMGWGMGPVPSTDHASQVEHWPPPEGTAT